MRVESKRSRRLVNIMFGQNGMMNRITHMVRSAMWGGLLCLGAASAHAEGQAAVGATAYPQYPAIAYGEGARAAELQRGEYLAKAGDCLACHTAPGGVPFAGGLGIKTPFGTLYAPNITPDKTTGIGNWTDAQFIKAMREGIAPDGHYYYPAFPYLSFNRVTDSDLKAIKSYLDALPAVQQANKEDTLMFPFSWRFMQLGWRTLFFYAQKQGPYVDQPNQSAQWNRGAYLVEGLGHCAMCHTPSHSLISEKYSLGAPIQKYALGGAMVGGYFAPAINAVGLKDIPVSDVVDVFAHDHLIGGGDVVGPMLEVNQDSLKYLSQSDWEAIAVYLKSVKSELTPKKSSGGTGAEAGKGTYDQYCTGCHSTGAGGAPKLGDATAWDPLIKQGMPTLYHNAIDGIRAMPPKGTCMSCTDQEIQNAVDYLVSAAQGGQGATTEAPTPSTPPPALTMADGQQMYQAHCAVCHSPQAHYLNAPALGDKAAWTPILSQGFDVVLLNTIHGVGNMPARGGCTQCTDAEIKAAAKYMAEESKTQGDYSLW